MLDRRRFTALFLASAGALAAQYRFDPEHARPVEATMEDLRRLNERWHYHGDEEDRLSDAMRHLHEFRERLRAGHFDPEQLDRAIQDTERVLHHNHMHDEGRHLLERDIAELRRLREHYRDSYRYPY